MIHLASTHLPIGPKPQSRSSHEKSKLDDPSQHLLVNSPGRVPMKREFRLRAFLVAKKRFVNDGGGISILYFTNLPNANICKSCSMMSNPLFIHFRGRFHSFKSVELWWFFCRKSSGCWTLLKLIMALCLVFTRPKKVEMKRLPTQQTII